MKLIDSFFKITERNSSIKTEVLAGSTTFITMAYIIFVQPAILAAGGMDFGAVLAATCITAAIASIMMGLYANYPIALAPAMGENFFFSFVVIQMLGVPWDIALGIIFISGVLFLALTFFNVREAIINSIPRSFKAGIAVGIGIFIAFIGLVYGGIVQKSPGGVLQLGDVRSVHVLLALLGVLIIAVCSHLKIRGAMLIGIVATTLLALPFGIVQFHGVVSSPPSIMPTLGKMRILEALSPQYIPYILVFLFMDLFDTVGTVVGVTQQAGLMKPDGSIPRLREILITDSLASVYGAFFGTSTIVTYVESSAGVQEGGRTGLTAVVTGSLFLGALFFEPLARMIGGGFTPAGTSLTLYPVIAPALIFVGSILLGNVTQIDFGDVTECLPAFLVMVGMPLTYSIADGLAFGFVSYPLLKLFTGRWREVHPIMYALGIVFVLRYALL
ncbi:MAG: NCS2 family permease [Spirochaetes bacterium]|nr:NCS2 family permease [Spirochaetota bacterium]